MKRLGVISFLVLAMMALLAPVASAHGGHGGHDGGGHDRGVTRAPSAITTSPSPAARRRPADRDVRRAGG